MSRRLLLLLGGLVLAASSLYASSIVIGHSAPVSEVEYAPFGGGMELPIAAANGDRALVIFNRGEGAVRIDAEGKPLDVPPILLPHPALGLGAEVIADADGWLVGWIGFESVLRLAQVTRDGALENVRDIPLPLPMHYAGPLQLAKRNGVLVAASILDFYNVVVMTESAHFTVPGALRELVATHDGFAMLMSDRIVLLAEDGSRIGDVPMPEHIAPLDVVADGEQLWIVGTASSTQIAVLRLDPNGIEIVARMTGHHARPRVALHDGNLALTWAALPAAPLPGAIVMWNLYAARLHAGGRIEGPQVLRENIGVSSKSIPGPDAPPVVNVNGRDVVVWREGPASRPTQASDLHAAPLPPTLQPIDEKTLLTVRARDQAVIGAAMFEDVVLVVWNERSDASVTTYARRIDVNGRAIDAEPINFGQLGSKHVSATSSGFLIATPSKRIRLGVSGPPIEEAHGVFRVEQQCAAGVCAWVENDALFFQRGDDAPVFVATVGMPYRGFTLVSNGTSALLAYPRASGTGTILTAVQIDATTHRVRDFAAAPRPLESLRLAWTGERYLALWLDAGVGIRGSYLDETGNAIDGPETNWEGWKLPLDVMPRQIASDGAHTILLYTNRLYELRERTPLPAVELDAQWADLACARDGVCALITQREVTGDPWFRAARVFTQRLSFLRSRAVRR